MLHLPGTKISPNPSKEYGLRQTDNVDFFSLGTLRTIGSCSLLPPPSQSQTKQTVIYEPSSQSDTSVYMYDNTEITYNINVSQRRQPLNAPIELARENLST